MQIVIAWTEQDFNVISTEGIDLGKTPKIEYYNKAKACMWLGKATEKDVVKAQKYVEDDGEGKTVIVFRKPVKEPLELAKQKILNSIK